MSDQTFPGVSLASHVRSGGDSHVYKIEGEDYYMKELRSDSFGGWMVKRMDKSKEGQSERARDLQIFFDHCEKYMGRHFQKPIVLLNTHFEPDRSRICLFQKSVAGRHLGKSDKIEFETAMASELGSSIDSMTKNIHEISAKVSRDFYQLILEQIDRKRIPDLELDNFIKTPEGELVMIDI